MGGVGGTTNADRERMAFLSRDRIAPRSERGFTLIELLLVMIIIAVLLAIAFPSFLGFKDRAQQRTAAANVRSAVPAAEAYYSVNNNSYAGMDSTALEAIDHVDANLTVVSDADHYCLSDTQGPHTAKVVGPGGTIDQSAAGACTSSTG